MPLRDDWQVRIKDVEREFLSAQIAMERLIDAVNREPAILKKRVEPRDVTRASEKLEGTYLTRMFAEFETGLRLYWATLRDTNPRMGELLDSIAGQRGIADEQRMNAHAVREYRNGLVHEREDDDVAAIPLATARGHLCRFFSFLPREW